MKKQLVSGVLTALFAVAFSVVSLGPAAPAGAAVKKTCKAVTAYRLVNKTVVVKGKTVVVMHKVRVHVNGRYVWKVKPVQIKQAYKKNVCTTLTRPKAYLDPTFTQAATNPLKVTWCASVNDNDKPSPCLNNNGVGASDNDPTLAPGVLDFYVGPQGTPTGLVCSINVGRTVNFADCTVNVASAGAYTVITEYVSGKVQSSASETDTIPAYSTTTSLSATQATSLPNWGNNSNFAQYCPQYGSTATSYCDAWDISASVVDQNNNTLQPSGFRVGLGGTPLGFNGNEGPSSYSAEVVLFAEKIGSGWNAMVFANHDGNGGDNWIPIANVTNFASNPTGFASQGGPSATAMFFGGQGWTASQAPTITLPMLP